MKKYIFISLSLCLLLLGLSALSIFSKTKTVASEQKDDNTPYIVSTTSQIGDLINNIVSATAKTEFLMGTGVDPHLYHPTRSDVSKMIKADIVFYNGMNLEGKMEHFLQELQSQKETISIANILNIGALEIIDESNNYDPHLWMNIENWIIASNKITEILSQTYSMNAQLYKNRNANYTKELKLLDDYAKRSIASIPEDKRIMITAHDAFGYFGSAYNIEVLGIQGISTESEAGIAKIKKTVDLIVSRKIPAIFVETSVGDHNIKAIIEGAKAQGHNLKIGGELYSDAMGPVGSKESTYIGMMAHNIKTITNALGGKAEAFEYDNKENKE